MSDTIFACATPPGQSAIALFRLSGQACFDIAMRLSGKKLTHRLAQPSVIYDEAGAMLDEVMLLYLKAPATPTGEDMLEIHCHGSLAVMQAITDYLARQGELRIAKAGEFTQRAFANQKMDLTEIEGLADLIDAQTDDQRRQAIHQLKGLLRQKATKWRDDIISLAARLESLIDFSDEDLPESVQADIEDKRKRLLDEIETALGDEGRGERIRNGVTITLIGPVNAGKSTALNALARRPAAIVSDEAGTTRDIVEVRLNLEGMAVSLLDTAGIRETDGTIERIGIERAHEAANSADLVLIMLDGADENWRQEAERLKKDIRVPSLTILNKKDLYKEVIEDADILQLSLHDDADIASLERHIIEEIKPLNLSGQMPIITRARHRQLLQKAKEGLIRSSENSLAISPELVGEDLRIAADALGQMTGHIDVEDILGDIFSSFCIGK